MLTFSESNPSAPGERRRAPPCHKAWAALARWQNHRGTLGRQRASAGVELFRVSPGASPQSQECWAPSRGNMPQGWAPTQGGGAGQQEGAQLEGRQVLCLLPAAVQGPEVPHLPAAGSPAVSGAVPGYTPGSPGTPVSGRPLPGSGCRHPRCWCRRR